MTNPSLSMWNISSKIHYFMGFWRFFCWRLWRPWMLLSTKSKGHKSKFRISWMYRYSYNNSKVHFWWPNKCLVSLRSSWNTLKTAEKWLEMVIKMQFSCLKFCTLYFTIWIFYNFQIQKRIVSAETVCGNMVRDHSSITSSCFWLF